MWVITAVLAVAVLVGAVIVSDVRASANMLTFEADEKLLAEGEEVRAELESRLTKARQDKAERLAEAERQEEEARRAEAERIAAEQARQSRLVAMHRSQSSSRTQVAASAPATGGTTKTATYYTPDPRENGGYGVTATGENLQDLVSRGENVVASNDYPLGTELKINGEWHRVADRMAHGGKVDFLVGTHAEARAGGRHQVVVEEVR